jgi:DNA-nicking Smr family endonuclease
MADDKRAGDHRPFKHLNRLIDRESLPNFRALTVSETDATGDPTPPENDGDLFSRAMTGVTPIAQDKYSPTQDGTEKPCEPLPADCGCDALWRLHRLIRTGDGFVVAETPEYQEGIGPRVPPLATRHLHGGRFSIQAHIDLHGLSVPEAERNLDQFLREAVRTGLRAVLVVHGRGLSSPRQPILKKKVREWLIRGAWRKWVMAYSSARLCDGGAGATYVLLRHRPLTRQYRKNRRRRITGA